MYQSVITSKISSIVSIKKKYLLSIIDIANKINSKDKYGLSISIDRDKYIKLKHLYKSLDNLSYCFRENVISDLDSIVSIPPNMGPEWSTAKVDRCLFPKGLNVN